MDLPAVEEKQRTLAREPVGGTDAEALVYLLGESMAFCRDQRKRREHLLAGLCDLTGADGWTALPRPGGEQQAPLFSPPSGTFISSGAKGETAILSEKKLPNGTSMILCLFRRPDRLPFTSREERLARIMLEEVPWLYETLVAHPPPPAVRTKPSRQEEISGLLRQGVDRKSIASRLGLSPHTVGTYQKKIYRELGVSSQVALMHLHSPKPGATP